MYKLKQKPEDFIVKEIPYFELQEKGSYPIFLLTKKNYTTEDAISKIAEYFHIKPKFIGYAGIKDKKSVSEQYISINMLKKQFNNVTFQDIKLTFVGYNDEPIYTGRLKGNQFVIIIRNLDDADIARCKNHCVQPLVVPNLYGMQRFSKNNVHIGKAIIKRDFKKAVELVLDTKGSTEQRITEYLEKHPSDFIGALRKIPLKICKLYVHAYQSELFNKAVEKYLKNNQATKNIKIPIIGFGTEFENNVIEEIYKKIMQEEGMTQRDFIIRGMHELSSEGNERNLFVEIPDFKILNITKDELNPGYKKMKVTFSLLKGSYATVVIDYLMRK